jgi:hypothetical protein
MSSIIDVPVLPILANPFIGVLEPPSLKQLRDFFDAHSHGDEGAHAHIKIDCFSPMHRLLAKIVLHNLWPIAHRSELVLKRSHLLYALVMRMSFCSCKHILNIMLDIRYDHSTSLPFVCLVMKICLQSVTNISVEPRMKV